MILYLVKANLILLGKGRLLLMEVKLKRWWQKAWFYCVHVIVYSIHIVHTHTNTHNLVIWETLVILLLHYCWESDTANLITPASIPMISNGPNVKTLDIDKRFSKTWWFLSFYLHIYFKAITSFKPCSTFFLCTFFSKVVQTNTLEAEMLCQFLIGSPKHFSESDLSHSSQSPNSQLQQSFASKA